MKKLWIYRWADSAAWKFAAHEPFLDDALEVKQGYFLTAAKLEQLAREAFENARRLVITDQGYVRNGKQVVTRAATQPSFKDFTNFWAEKKKEIEG